MAWQYESFEIEKYQRKDDKVIEGFSALDFLGTSISTVFQLGTDKCSFVKRDIINQIENGWLQGAKNNHDLTPKVKKYCKCYANWFNENLNQSELNEFLNKSKIDKKKFIRSNNIAGSSSSICKI